MYNMCGLNPPDYQSFASQTFWHAWFIITFPIKLLHYTEYGIPSIKIIFTSSYDYQLPFPKELYTADNGPIHAKQ